MAWLPDVVPAHAGWRWNSPVSFLTRPYNNECVNMGFSKRTCLNIQGAEQFKICQQPLSSNEQTHMCMCTHTNTCAYMPNVYTLKVSHKI